MPFGRKLEPKPNPSAHCFGLGVRWWWRTNIPASVLLLLINIMESFSFLMKILSTAIITAQHQQPSAFRITTRLLIGYSRSHLFATGTRYLLTKNKTSVSDFCACWAITGYQFTSTIVFASWPCRVLGLVSNSQLYRIFRCNQRSASADRILNAATFVYLEDNYAQGFLANHVGISPYSAFRRFSGTVNLHYIYLVWNRILFSDNGGEVTRAALVC